MPDSASRLDTHQRSVEWDLPICRAKHTLIGPDGRAPPNAAYKPRMRFQVPDDNNEENDRDMAEFSTPYQALGEQGIRDLANAFYDIMDTLPEAAGIRAMHGKDLTSIKERLAEYLIGWMGGPPIYAQKYGSVCMTEPHAGYAIGESERDQWLLCMEKALDKIEADPALREMLKEPLFAIADMVRNR